MKKGKKILITLALLIALTVFTNNAKTPGYHLNCDGPAIGVALT